MTRPPAPGFAALFAAPFWLAALMTAVPAAAQPLQPVPPLEARVTDLTGTLTQAEQAELEAQLAAFESRKGAQIAVLIVPSTEPEAIEQYSIRVVDAWKLGRAAPDDGANLRDIVLEREIAVPGLRPREVGDFSRHPDRREAAFEHVLDPGREFGDGQRLRGGGEGRCCHG